jgi:hypothetical protein
MGKKKDGDVIEEVPGLSQEKLQDNVNRLILFYKLFGRAYLRITEEGRIFVGTDEENETL